MLRGVEEERPCQIQRDAEHKGCDGKAAFPEQRAQNENRRRDESHECQYERRRRELLASARRRPSVLARQPVDRGSDKYGENRAAEKGERNEYG